jgi:sterol desaturase/sphingolipid hydroxylase (fatty acid hydroxylase superfamily)
MDDEMTAMLRRITESRANYLIAYLIDFCCPLVFAYLGWHALPWPQAMLSLLAGAFAFSLVEYAIHRWLFHSSSSFMSALHHTHHASPQGPTSLPCISSAVVSLVLWRLAVDAVGPGIAAFFLCGFFGWYFVYAALHHFEHHTAINHLPSRWLQRRWANHTLHHRRADTNFGVTTSLWDRVFRTHYQSGKRRCGLSTMTGQPRHLAQ